MLDYCNAHQILVFIKKHILVLQFCTSQTPKKQTAVQTIAIQHATTAHRALKIRELVLYDVQVKQPVK